jgi:hypothetical protein
MVASACGGAQTRSAHADSGHAVRGGGSSPSATLTSPQLQQRFDALARSLETQGVQFEGIASSGFITHGSNITTPIDIPANTCVSIIAIASTSIHDLDAHLFDPDGNVIVEDIETDPHPTVQLCATDARRVYHVIETFVSDSNASEGHGAYAIGVFRSDRHGLEAVARAIGGHPGQALSSSNNGTDAERRLSELREGIGRRGFLPNADTIRATFTAAGSVRYPLNVVPDRCYTYAALAEGELHDVDISVYDADGEEIARDIRPDRDAFVQLCPAAAQTLQVELRARPPGMGIVLLQSFAADAASVGGANTLWLGERMAWQASATPLAQALDATRSLLEAQGYAHPATSATSSFAPGESREQRVTLEAGHCTAIAAVVGRGLGRVSLAAHTANGDFLARGTFHGAASVAILCPTAREELQLHVRADVGTGDAAVVTATGGAPPAWANGGDRVAVSEALATQLSMASQTGWRAEGNPERVRLGARAIRNRDVDLAGGTCTRFAVSAGAGLPTVSLVLRASNGNVVAQGGADGTAIVTRCVQANERVRLEMSIDPPSAIEYDAFLARFTRRGGS